MTFLLVATGAAVGGPIRWWVDQVVQRRWAPVFPLGTFVVNAVGSSLLGVCAALWADDVWWALIGIGLCGSMTTFSSFAWETFRLFDDGAWRLAVCNAVGSVAICTAAAALGWCLLT